MATDSSCMPLTKNWQIDPRMAWRSTGQHRACRNVCYVPQETAAGLGLPWETATQPRAGDAGRAVPCGCHNSRDGRTGNGVGKIVGSKLRPSTTPAGPEAAMALASGRRWCAAGRATRVVRARPHTRVAHNRQGTQQLQPSQGCAVSPFSPCTPAQMPRCRRTAGCWPHTSGCRSCRTWGWEPLGASYWRAHGRHLPSNRPWAAVTNMQQAAHALHSAVRC